MLSTEMTYIACATPGGPESLHVQTGPMPVPGTGEVLIQVVAAGLNRADLLQRRGKYPPPIGASDILGMEVSGIVTALGTGVKRWKIGDKVCALLAGGGYAEYATVDERHCLPVPPHLSLRDAAALPEAITTVYANIFETGALRKGETVLIHGGSSGIGTTAIQMVKLYGGSVVATVGSEEKTEACYALGADYVVNYHEDDFVLTALRATDKRGVDVVLDMVGGDYINRNLRALNFKGRHVSIATQQSAMAEIDIRLIMQKQLIVTGSTLRGRDGPEKARLMAKIEAEIWPWVATGTLKPVIFQSFALKNAAEAHKMMESGAHIGKIVLEIA